jgi:hypothetical protein
MSKSMSKSGRDYMSKRSATHRTNTDLSLEKTAENSSEEFIIMKHNEPFPPSSEEHQYNGSVGPQAFYTGNSRNEISTGFGSRAYRLPSTEEDKNGIQVTTTVEVMPSSKLDV